MKPVIEVGRPGGGRLGWGVKFSTEQPLDLGELLGVLSPECGALVLFLGCVRDSEDGRPISAIRYEAYRGMAERKLRSAAEEAGRRYGARVLVRHRLGRVGVGAPALAVACAAPHRAEAFQAARFVVERIKRDVPIWKVAFEGAEGGPPP